MPSIFARAKAIIFALLGFTIGIGLVYFISFEMWNSVIKPFVNYLGWEFTATALIVPLLF